MNLPSYSRINEFILQILNVRDTFLHDRSSNDNYGFWPHFEYFLTNLTRFRNHKSILDRLSVTAPLSMGKDRAWDKWINFRAAQHEVTCIFLIEQYFLGKVLEIIPEDNTPTPDLKVKLSRFELLVEIKSQSGQQRGDKHPREKGVNHFDPKDESDLKSWLFEERISSRDNRPMRPKTQEAEGKGANILVALTDFFSYMHDINSQVSFLCPNSNLVETRTIKIQKGEPLTIYFFQAEFPVSLNLNNLQEIWLFNESHLSKFIVLSKSMFLLDHLRKQNN